MAELICFKCSKGIQFSGKIGRREDCTHCGADLHCCRNCHFYDKNSYNECKETSADVVQEKERSNFCDYFQPRVGGVNGKSASDLKAAAEALFKKKEG